MPRAARALLATLLALVAIAAVGAISPARAADVGISDGHPALFDAEQLRDVDFREVRLVLPWDAALHSGTWDTWLERATQRGLPALIAPSASGAVPTATEYEAALRTLLDRYPVIDAVEGWNEPNHVSQPTASKPALAASYFEAARRACANRCTAVAGNLLDAPSMTSYLSAYRAALTTEPAVWGIHDYYDATYFQRKGLDAMLAITNGPVWLTETGGLVSFEPDGPGTGLLPDEHRAADSLRWLFSLAASEPRVARVYLYGLWQEPWNPFDSALLRVDNSERESMAVVRQYVGARSTAASPPPGAPSGSASGTPDASAGTSPAATPLLRLVGKRIRVGLDRRVHLTMRCLLATCAGTLRVSVGGWRYQRSVRLAAGATRTIQVRLTRAAVRGLGPAHRAKQHAATLCAGASCSTVPIVGH